MSDDESWQRVLGKLWQGQSSWSRRADELKRSYRSWTGPLVAVGFLGVVISTLSPELVEMFKSPRVEGAAVSDRNFWQMAAAVAGPLLVAVAAALTRELRGGTTDQLWAKARGIAEALKAQGYLYAAGAPPYSDKLSAPQQLATAMIEITSAAAGEIGPPEPVKDVQAKHPHEVLSVQNYIDRRVVPQAEYHEREALANRNQLKRWRAVGMVLATIAAALGVIAGFGKSASMNVWVAVVSTAIATLTSFIYAGRFEYFTATYFATATKLRGRLLLWEAAQDKSPAERDRFIIECEAILATQNQSWMTELSKRASEELDELNKRRSAAAAPRA